MATQEDDIFDEDATDIMIGSRDWTKMESGLTKLGYRDGHAEGQGIKVQEGFNSGYCAASSLVFRIAVLRGEISALLSLKHLQREGMDTSTNVQLEQLIQDVRDLEERCMKTLGMEHQDDQSDCRTEEVLGDTKVTEQLAGGEKVMDVKEEVTGDVKVTEVTEQLAGGEKVIEVTGGGKVTKAKMDVAGVKEEVSEGEQVTGVKEEVSEGEQVTGIKEEVAVVKESRNSHSCGDCACKGQESENQDGGQCDNKEGHVTDQGVQSKAQMTTTGQALNTSHFKSNIEAMLDNLQGRLKVMMENS